MNLEFPAALPIPQELPTQSAERRVLSPEGGFFEVRVGQTDRKAYEDYSFPPYSPTQAEALDYFWRVTLNKGGKWFSTPTGRHWPRPEGWIAATRRFVDPPNWEYIHTGKAEGGYWRVTGTFEVRGTGELPRLSATLFLLHFNSNLVDECGGAFVADSVISDGGPNLFNFTSTSPKFGPASGRATGPANHVKSGNYGDLRFSTFDFQAEGFVRPDSSLTFGGTVLTTGSLVAGGDVIGPGVTAGQFEVKILVTGEFVVTYSTLASNEEIPRVIPATPTLIAADVWSHWALVNDATSFRLYVNGVLANEAPGVRPYAGAYVNQQFFVASSYAGGIPPSEVYAGYYYGDVDEMRLLREVTYTGPSIVVPIAPFSRF